MSTSTTETDHTTARPPVARARDSLGAWIALAVGSLVVSGVLALLLVVGRLPQLAAWLPPPTFFRRCLVVHVNLSLVVWLLSFSTALTFLLPSKRHDSWVSRLGVFVALGGVLLMLVSAGAAHAEPILANYVPAIDHWLFRSGQWVLGLGVVLALFDARLLPIETPLGGYSIPSAVIPGLRATGIAILLTALTSTASWLAAPTGLEPRVLYELTGWGPGHVLQLAASTAMASVWLLLLSDVLGASPIGRHGASALFGLLLTPWLIAPQLALSGIDRAGPREIYTGLMRFGIAPAMLWILVACCRAIHVAFREGRLTRAHLGDPRLLGFFASALLTVQGYVLGALIRDSSTVIPAHYHAAIGGVTVSFMAVTYPTLARLGIDLRATVRRRRLAAVQPALFGLGQAVFALGFAFAGVHGTARKVYGAEQHTHSLGQVVGLWVMGIGGLGAVAGGLLYLGLVVSGWKRQARLITRSPLLSLPKLEQRHG